MLCLLAGNCHLQAPISPTKPALTSRVSLICANDNSLASSMQSSIPSGSFLLVLEASKLASTQVSVPDIQAYKTAITGLHLQPVKFGDVNLLCYVSLGQARPVIPDFLRRQMFNNLHSLAHPGIRATQKLISDHFIWHKMRHYIHSWTRSCLSCLSSKIHHHNHAEIVEIHVPP